VVVADSTRCRAGSSGSGGLVSSLEEALVVEVEVFARRSTLQPAMPLQQSQESSFHLDHTVAICSLEDMQGVRPILLGFVSRDGG